MNWKQARIRREAALSAAGFSASHHADFDPDGSWVVIRDMPLPDGYNRRVTDILFQLPAGYPRTPPDWFFVDPGLRGPGGTPFHYFEKMDDQAPTLRGWAACSLHIMSWQPGDDPTRGHSLLTLCQLATDAFHRWKR